jgi:hypothetical protein
LIDSIENPAMAPYDFNLLRGWLLCKLGECESALEVLQIARNQIETERSLSQADKNYLMTFAAWNIDYAGNISGRGTGRTDPGTRMGFDRSQLQHVKSRFLRAFPLPHQP